MAENFPVIEPSSFDVIVIGTGLQESILAAAAATAGHTVLHLDPCPFYGFHWTSLSLDEFTLWATSGGRLPIPNPTNSSIANEINGTGTAAFVKGPEGEDLELEPLTDRTLYSDFEICNTSSDSLGPSRAFNLDIAGPRLAFCGGPLVDLLLKAGASNYLEFKCVEGSYIWSGLEPGLSPVPDSRASIFQDRTLSLAEKRHLMRFFKLVQNHAEAGQGERAELTAEVLESRFVDFLDQQRLPSSIKSIILYAIALADHDQEELSEEPSTVITTKDGIESLVLYLSSIGRFVNASGAFLYPVYGQAELPQAFSRSASVKGALYVLRMPVTGVLIDKESRKYKGIQTASGQYLFSQKLVVNASIMLSSSLSSSLAELRVGEIELGDVCVPQPVPLSEDILLRTQEMQSYAVQHPPRISLKVARSVCITNQSLQSEISTLLVVFPPRSVCSGHRAAIRALQLGSNTSVCPQGVFVVYFSTLCSDIAQGKEALNAAIDSLFILPNMTHSEYENASLHEDVTSKRRKPTLLWSVFFVQHLAENLSKPIAMCCMPDGTLDYRGLVMSTTKMFQDLFPTEELFPQKLDSEDTVENGDNYNGDLLI
eukprot:Gb_39257 [translate_table: standard]